MLTLEQAATQLGLAASSLRWQIRNGKLRARKVGPVWTVSEREVERYRKEHLRRH
jgi:excisionase family DNA binding protein